MKKILVIVGPTASGKSTLAIKLAKKFNGEIISADSRQVYKGLDIGTGKVTKKEMRGIPHHLLDVADPKDQFTAADFKRLAEESVRYIVQKDKLPIVVGGTGFYIDALTGAKSIPEVPVNKKLRKILEKKSVTELYKILSKKDPRRAKNIDPHNKVRLVRALEIIEALGLVPPSTPSVDGEYKYVFIGISVPKEELNIKILKRLMSRLKSGMINEAQTLHKKGLSYKRMEDLGLEYRYLAKFLKKEISKKELIDELYKEIKRYSRRQKQWFKYNKRIKWFELGEFKAIEKYVRMATKGL